MSHMKKLKYQSWDAADTGSDHAHDTVYLLPIGQSGLLQRDQQSGVPAVRSWPVK